MIETMDGAAARDVARGSGDAPAQGRASEGGGARVAEAEPGATRTEHETLLALGFPSSARPVGRTGARPPRGERGRLRTVTSEFAAEERGAVTAEYTLVVVAGVAFAGALIALMRSEEIRAMLAALLQSALGSAG